MRMKGREGVYHSSGPKVDLDIKVYIIYLIRRYTNQKNRAISWGLARNSSLPAPPLLPPTVSLGSPSHNLYKPAPPSSYHPVARRSVPCRARHGTAAHWEFFPLRQSARWRLCTVSSVLRSPPA